MVNKQGKAIATMPSMFMNVHVLTPESVNLILSCLFVKYLMVGLSLKSNLSTFFFCILNHIQLHLQICLLRLFYRFYSLGCSSKTSENNFDGNLKLKTNRLIKQA